MVILKRFLLDEEKKEVKIIAKNNKDPEELYNKGWVLCNYQKMAKYTCVCCVILILMSRRIFIELVKLEFF